MSVDATGRPVSAAAPARRRGLAERLPRALGVRLEGARRAGELADARSGTTLGAVALLAIVALSLFVVLIAANRPSLLTPTTYPGYFPRWMAGPLGGLLPWLTSGSTALRYMFTGAVVLMYAGYLVALVHARRLPVRWLVSAIVATHAIFLLAPPLALTDVFNYINYGRMEVVHHLNPYTTIPVFEPHADPSFPLSNWHQLLSPYGPLFTLLTFVVVPLGVAASFWALKAILVACSLGTIALVWRCARLLGRHPAPAIALVGLNPLMLVWGLGGDHNDFPMLLAIMLGFYLLLLVRARGPVAPAAGAVADGRLPAAELGAGAAFVTATAIKASAGILLPVVLAGLLRTPRTLARVVAGMLAAGVVLGAASLLAFGLHLPDLSTQGSLVTGESVPNLIGLALGLGGETAGLRHVLSGVLVTLVLACCWLAWRGGAGAGAHRAGEGSGADGGGPSARAGLEPSITASGWASVALLVTLSWVLPWYVVWVLPLAALSRSRALRATALALGVYLIVAWAPASGLLWKAIGFDPAKTSLGRLHQRYVKELLD